MILLKEINLEMLKLLNRISCSSKFPQVRVGQVLAHRCAYLIGLIGNRQKPA